jgi:superoxide dismutase
MKVIIKYSIAVMTITFIIFSCQKQIDYGPEIALLKSDIASLKSSITTITAQLTSLEASLKAKIDLTNAKIDVINAEINTLNTKTITGLTTDILAINSSIKNTNTESTKRLDSLRTAILKIDTSINGTAQSVTSLSELYNKLLTNYVEILKIIKSTLAVVEINGAVFKGSFIRGSLLNFYELDSKLNQTGRSFNTTIDDDYGNFEIKAQNLAGKLIRVVGDGFYWNEVLNENSSSRITLTALSKIDSNETVNVNVLTQLERPRVEYLYGVKGLSFVSAKTQAVTEVLKAFGFTNTGINRAEKVGVVGIGDDSKILLSISTLMQGFRTESEVTQIMSDFANDLKKDGTLDNVTIGNDLATHLYYIDTTAVLNNFKTKYKLLYNSDTVNSIDMRFIKNFQNNTTYAKDKELIIFPDKSNYLVDNILSSKINELSSIVVGRGIRNAQDNIGYDIYGWNYGMTSIINRKGMKLKIEILDENNKIITPLIIGSCLWNSSNSKINGWVNAGCTDNIFRAETVASYDYINSINDQNSLTRGKKIKINFYERNYTMPSRTKIVTFK